MDPAGVVLMLAACLMWGSTFAVAKVGLQDGWSPLNFVAIRVVLSSVFLFAVVAVRGLPLGVPRSLLPTIALVGLFNITVTYATSFVAMADPGMPSGIGMLLMCTQPFWVAFLGVLLLRDEPFTPCRAVGLGLGFAGVALLAAGRLGDGPSGLVSPALVLAASLGWAVGTIMARRLGTTVDAPRLTSWHMLFGAVFLVPLALAFEPGHPVPLGLAATGSLIYLAVAGGALPTLIWFFLLERHGATRLSPFIFLVPVFAVLLGVALLGESLSLPMLASTALVAAGIFWINRGP